MTSNEARLAGRSAIVTGAGRGIGREIALKLAGDGARVVVNDLDDGPAREAVAAIRGRGGEATAFVGDVTAADFGERIVARTLEAYGDVHIIVNNAGYIWNTTIQNNTDEQWAAMLEVHASAPFRLLRAATGHFREASRAERAEGRVVMRKVVNISSISALHGAATQVSYAAGKSAVVGLTRALCQEWGRYNVNVNAVAFGMIATRLTQPWQGEKASVRVGGREHDVGLAPEQIEDIRRRTPLGRLGSAEEAAGAVYLLCLPESDFISGQVLFCTGGL